MAGNRKISGNIVEQLSPLITEEVLLVVAGKMTSKGTLEYPLGTSEITPITGAIMVATAKNIESEGCVKSAR